MKTENPYNTVSGIMHRHVVTADIATSARDCANLIARERVGCLIITKNGAPAGIVTERSFVHLAKKGIMNPNRIKAADFMSSPLLSISPKSSFPAAMQIFSEKNIKRLPVVQNHKVVGLLTLKNMIEFANISLTALDKEHRKLKSSMEIDPLTGVLTKSAIARSLETEYERIRRYGGRSSILFLDIDHFKKINDQYSHMAGDAFLKELGALLKKTCRQVDLVGRFGGEEFLIIAPNRKKYHAVQFGIRLRRAVESHTFTFKGLHVNFSVSIGISSLFVGRSSALALERADKALYHAKHAGRNRIGLWRDGKPAIAEEEEKEGPLLI